ncbi:phage virion morphogenesis protein [Rhodovulum euryhalinum]|uniref:Phage virion morphogenesis protein n=1 Tax=Rhodovulum euryhalinum TaxID=35805 RepID=A0A4R2KNW3_9RHOB|nr:phage virion morphogenesis protein [Rhodovulum euryhalinum]TCO74287.1 phage virion morphogenesis protein [Rhodovulum euryhalinum]
MTGVTMTVTLDDREAREKLRALVDRMERPEGFYKLVGDAIVNSTKENFQSESAPDGTPWAPHAPSTIRQRIRRGQVPITKLRTNSFGQTLYNQLNARPSPEGVTVGSPMPYGAIHQLGGTVKRQARTGRLFGRDSVSVRAYTITIPARPYLGLSAEDEETIIQIADDWLRS